MGEKPRQCIIGLKFSRHAAENTLAVIVATVRTSATQVAVLVARVLQCPYRDIFFSAREMQMASRDFIMVQVLCEGLQPIRFLLHRQGRRPKRFFARCRIGRAS